MQNAFSWTLYPPIFQGLETLIKQYKNTSSTKISGNLTNFHSEFLILSMGGNHWHSLVIYELTQVTAQH